MGVDVAWSNETVFFTPCNVAMTPPSLTHHHHHHSSPTITIMSSQDVEGQKVGGGFEGLEFVDGVVQHVGPRGEGVHAFATGLSCTQAVQPGKQDGGGMGGS